MSIIVRRSGALGDVVLTTPIVRRLRRENPTANIAVITNFPDVFRYSQRNITSFPLDLVVNRLIDLDFCYEEQPDLHIVQAYMLEAFDDLGDPADFQQELFFPKRTMFSYDRKFVAVHAAVAGWANRTLPRATWREVVTGLRKAGLWPILVGSPRDDIPDSDTTRFFSTDILAQAGLIDGCAAFVGSDSGLAHIAGSTNTPIVTVFTCARPETRLPWRNGILGWNCTALVPDIPCVGCLARRLPPVTSEFCERGDNVCVTLIKPDEIIEAVIKIVDNNR